VTALDVGRGQLAPEVAADDRVTERSGTTVRGLAPEDIGGRVDLIVADLSFISLTLVVGDLARLLDADGEAVVLVKPQFEVGRARLGKGGVVRSAADRAWAVTEVARAAIDAGLHPKALAPSPIEGGEGNVEYLLWLTPRAAESIGWQALVRNADQVSVEGAS
jgi:23S rRNA (cytidine1920-2'-O)/16S rRNA (cytidine1409-2'-O)-methyltransferase